MSEPKIFCDRCKKWHGKWSCPLAYAPPHAANEIERLTAELNQARAELRRVGCPIGLYETPEICSAGTCNKCLAARLKDVESKLEAQE